MADENTSSAPGPGAPGPVPSGLTWALKPSFLSYLSRMPDLKSSIAKGAVTGATGFFFPILSADGYHPATGQGTLTFSGDIRFSGHYGMLFVMFAEPWVIFDGDQATLSIADPASHPALDQRLPLLDLEVLPYQDGSGTRTWSALPATLRPEAVEFFNEAYPAGEPFAPVDLRIEL